MITEETGFHRIDIVACLAELFELDSRATDAAYTLKINDEKELLDFLTVEYRAEVWTYRNNEGIVVGYIALSPSGSETIELLCLGVVGELRGLGYGELLLTYAEHLAKLGRYRKIKLITSTENVPALSLYNKLGYQIEDTINDAYGDQIVRHVLAKQLKNRKLLQSS